MSIHGEGRNAVTVLAVDVPPGVIVVRACTRCGVQFTASPTGGRPRSRCDRCRSNHDRADGKVWRTLRAQVLAEEPFCYIAGCRRPSTQVDHVIPLKYRPDLAHERGNLRGICATHNASKGAKVGGQVLVTARPKPRPPAAVCQFCSNPNPDGSVESHGCARGWFL